MAYILWWWGKRYSLLQCWFPLFSREYGTLDNGKHYVSVYFHFTAGLAADLVRLVGFGGFVGTYIKYKLRKFGKFEKFGGLLTIKSTLLQRNWDKKYCDLGSKVDLIHCNCICNKLLWRFVYSITWEDDAFLYLYLIEPSSLQHVNYSVSKFIKQCNLSTL